MAYAGHVSSPSLSPSMHNDYTSSVHVASSGGSPQHWQDAYLELEQDKRQLQGELHGVSDTVAQLQREAQLLREQVEAEQQRRRERVGELSKQVEDLERENKHLNMRLLKVQMQDSAKLNGVTTVKKEVVARTMELEKVLREFQQTQQDKLFTRLFTVTGAMMSTCQRPTVQVQLSTPPGTEDELPGARPSAPSAAFISAAPAAEAASEGTFLDAETQQALKRRLQSLGDVVVYANDKFEACCASGRAIPPGALRVRPRRCDHIFLVECLMPHWAEGLCPVCRCSFAYDRPQDAGFDESDRYSSVSTSVSQMVRPQLPRSSSTSDGGSLRGPRGAHRGGSSDGCGRSASLPRQLRRQRSSPHRQYAADGRSEASLHGDRMSSFSPPRSAHSVASLHSRGSSPLPGGVPSLPGGTASALSLGAASLGRPL